MKRAPRLCDAMRKSIAFRDALLLALDAERTHLGRVGYCLEVPHDASTMLTQGGDRARSPWVGRPIIRVKSCRARPNVSPSEPSLCRSHVNLGRCPPMLATTGPVLAKVCQIGQISIEMGRNSAEVDRVGPSVGPNPDVRVYVSSTSLPRNQPSIMLDQCWSNLGRFRLTRSRNPSQRARHRPPVHV